MDDDEIEAALRDAIDAYLATLPRRTILVTIITREPSPPEWPDDLFEIEE